MAEWTPENIARLDAAWDEMFKLYEELSGDKAVTGYLIRAVTDGHRYCAKIANKALEHPDHASAAIRRVITAARNLRLEGGTVRPSMDAEIVSHRGMTELRVALQDCSP